MPIQRPMTALSLGIGLIALSVLVLVWGFPRVPSGRD
jgi:hypothetical protein